MDMSLLSIALHVLHIFHCHPSCFSGWNFMFRAILKGPDKASGSAWTPGVGDHWHSLGTLRCLQLMLSGKPPWCVTLERLMFMAGSVLWPANHLQPCTWSCEQAGKRTPLKCHHPTPSTRSGPCVFLRLWTPTSSGSNWDSSCDSEWFCSLSQHPFN